MKLSRKTLANIGYDYEIADNGDIEFLFTGVIDSRRQEAMQSIAATIEVLGYEGRDGDDIMEALYEKMFRIDIATCIKS